MKALVLVLIGLIFLLSGCISVSEKELQENCRKEGKQYVVTEQFNFRTGKVEKLAKCQ